jgi:hypothetical protein
MHMRCPLCGALFFYQDDMESFSSFKVTLEGQADEVRKEGIRVELTPNSEVFCVSCAWHGTVLELEDSQ